MKYAALIRLSEWRDEVSNIVKEEFLICADIGKNNNKHWHGILYNDARIFAEWGRVGGATDSKTWTFSSQYAAEKEFDAKVKEKMTKKKPPYTRQQTIGGANSVVVNDLAAVAKKQIKTNSPKTQE